MDTEYEDTNMYCKHIQDGEAVAATEQEVGPGIILFLCKGCDEGMRDKVQSDLGSYMRHRLEQALSGE